ncbi:MAG: DUF3450 family protein [Verrucomicrobiae bacterium]|nr:DUF3450 family protein [Verrucomicrobiae bacterium]
MSRRVKLSASFGIVWFAWVLSPAQENPDGSGVQVPPPAVVQEKLREWVKVKKLISEETSKWEEERQTLVALNELRKREVAQMEELTQASGNRLQEAEAQRRDLLSEEEALRQRRATLEEQIENAEEALRRAIPVFPPPLREKVEASIARVEMAGAEMPLQDRFRELLIVARAAVEFQQSITVSPDLREFQGEQVEVDVLYLGLSQAWFVDRRGDYAGSGSPSEQGWQWTEDRRMAGPIRKAINIHRKHAAPELVSLPFAKRADAPTTKTSVE